MAAVELGVYGFMATALAAVAFMFQSRHHNLYSHESSIEKDIENIEEKIAELNVLDESARRESIAAYETRIGAKLDEYLWVRRRYDFALVALICLMVSLLCVLICGIRAAHTAGL